MNICVFCGSSTRNDAAYRQAAEATGRLLGERGIGLVYGGGHVGLMGVVADAALAADGEVTGVIPCALLERELAREGLTLSSDTQIYALRRRRAGPGRWHMPARSGRGREEQSQQEQTRDDHGVSPVRPPALMPAALSM